jgi:hypothetical protein
MNTQEIAKKLAIRNRTIAADKYDLYLRDYDNKIELIGLVPDPNYNIKDFVGKEMLFPKRWLTLKVFDYETEIPT